MLAEFSRAPPGFTGFDAREVGRLRRQPWTNVQKERARLAAMAGISPTY
jgi:hypothetical protein